MNTTHTYVVLEVSDAAHDEIAGLLRAAGYDHVFDDACNIDLHGIALGRKTPATAPEPDYPIARWVDLPKSYWKRLEMDPRRENLTRDDLIARAVKAFLDA